MHRSKKYDRMRIKPKWRGGSLKQKRLQGKRAAGYAPCVECGGRGRPVSGDVVYPHRTHLHKKIFYLCDCGAYVGSHEKSGEPLGYPCGYDSRRARNRAHAAFDPLWECKLFPDRRAAYAWLASAMGIDPLICHIAKMGLSDSNRVTRLCEEYWNDHATEKKKAARADWQAEKNGFHSKLRKLHREQDEASIQAQITARAEQGREIPSGPDRGDAMRGNAKNGNRSASCDEMSGEEMPEGSSLRGAADPGASQHG
jgi:hypothetical protein